MTGNYSFVNLLSNICEGLRNIKKNWFHNVKEILGSNC